MGVGLCLELPAFSVLCPADVSQPGQGGAVVATQGLGQVQKPHHCCEQALVKPECP